MEKIGFQLAGPTVGGFDKVLEANWQGDPLYDESSSKKSTGKFFYAVYLGVDYITYELVLNRFTNSEGAKAVFKVGLRIPAKSTLIGPGGTEVGASVILDELLKVTAENYIELGSKGYAYRKNSLPAFSLKPFLPVLSNYRMVPRWGKAVVMTGNWKSQPLFVAADSAQAELYMRQLPLCARVEPAGRIVLGEFAQDVTLFSLTEAELDAKPKMQVKVAYADGTLSVKPDLTMPLVLDSDNFGYSPQVYENVEFTLSRQKVLEAVRNKTLYAAPKGVNVSMKPAAGVVTVQFSPTPVIKTFTIQFENKLPADSDKDLFGALVFLNQGKEFPLTKGSLTFEGENIQKFERRAAQADFVKLFRLTSTDRYAIENVTMAGDKINISLSLIPQSAVEATQMAESAPVAPVPAPVERQAPKLTLKLPLCYSKALTTLDFVVKQAARNREYVTYCNDVAVKKSESGYSASVEIATMRNAEVNVLLGSPLKYRVKARRTVSEAGVEYLADITPGTKIGALHRLADLFRFKESENLSGGAFFGRAFVLFLVALVLFTLGVIFGTCCHESILTWFGERL